MMGYSQAFTKSIAMKHMYPFMSINNKEKSIISGKKEEKYSKRNNFKVPHCKVEGATFHTCLN